MQNQPTSTDPEWTIIKLLRWTTSYFESRDIDGPRIEAEILLAHVLQLQRIDLYLRYDEPLSSNELSRFKDLIKRRINREPVAYIVGSKEFWSMDFIVTKDVLIPRPETEFLVETAINLLPQDSAFNPILTPKRILELGTGSGAVVLALASMRPCHLFFASDRMTAAVRLAKKNAKHHGFESRVSFICAGWFESFKDKRPVFDMIVSNPPYIPSRVIGKLQPEIVKHEPISAIDGGEDGLFCLRHIINNAHLYLQRKGHLLLEIGHDQRNDVRKIVDQCAKYENVIYTKDYSGYDRVVQMRKK
ncbi:MAG: peptide chain release factor N(5)-glutamine methyltransferase [Desulfobacterales bacterium]|jgi:release factor glutamine methyltransferase|nr:peptide chain release factor N(5)-glutamine methyltransferase [Desulfobacterales bacterium]